jgi:hypothetical protein
MRSELNYIRSRRPSDQPESRSYRQAVRVVRMANDILFLTCNLGKIVDDEICRGKG